MRSVDPDIPRCFFFFLNVSSKCHSYLQTSWRLEALKQQNSSQGRGEGTWMQAKWQECLQLAEITWYFSPKYKKFLTIVFPCHLSNTSDICSLKRTKSLFYFWIWYTIIRAATDEDYRPSPSSKSKGDIVRFPIAAPPSDSSVAVILICKIIKRTPHWGTQQWDGVGNKSINCIHATAVHGAEISAHTKKKQKKDIMTSLEALFWPTNHYS